MVCPLTLWYVQDYTVTIRQKNVVAQQKKAKVTNPWIQKDDMIILSRLMSSSIRGRIVSVVKQY